jgi:muramoyltetrapeptide carboxypeptidase
MSRGGSIGIIAPSSVAPRIEVGLAVRTLEESGFRIRVHKQVFKRHRYFAGTDEERAEAFYEYATDPGIEVLWCARGGHGALRILPLLDALAGQHGAPPAQKLLIGYSDATALMEYARTRWGWSTLHGPMPGLKEFSALRYWKSLVDMIEGRRTALPYERRRLRFVSAPPSSRIRGELTGGNLTLWAAMSGTPYAGVVSGKIVFFEDVGEALYRIDRTVQSLALAGAFRGARALVLGTFEDCNDSVPKVFSRAPRARSRAALLRPAARDLKPLRPAMQRARALRDIFGELGEKAGISVATGLPVGHGPDYPPLPLGGIHSIHPDGSFRLESWAWFE